MSTPQWQQRHQDYVVGPNQDKRLASVAPGDSVTGIDFQFENDAPFLMRGRAYRVSYDALDSRVQVGLNTLAFKWSKADGRSYRSQGYIPQNLAMPYGGQGGAWKPVYPQILYPAGSTMRLDLVNTGAAALVNLTFYFRGVKLFPWGMNPAYTYPSKIGKIIPFVYPIAPITQLNLTGSIQNLLIAESRLLQQFNVRNDADFVVRYGQAGPSYSPFGAEVFFILRDDNRKAFSNDYVHYETLFGPSSGNYPCGGVTIPAIGTGNSLPSTFFPEFYLPASHLMYYDVQRADSGYGGAATIPNFPVNLVGSKVYPG
jgi:hypothetical protein